MKNIISINCVNLFSIWYGIERRLEFISWNVAYFAAITHCLNPILNKFTEDFDIGIRKNISIEAKICLINAISIILFKYLLQKYQETTIHLTYMTQRSFGMKCQNNVSKSLSKVWKNFTERITKVKACEIENPYKNTTI